MTEQPTRAGKVVEGLRSSAPSTPSPTPIATAGAVLVWKGHRLRARSGHRSVIEAILLGCPTKASRERTGCGIDLPEGELVTIEIDGEVTCAGCAGYARPDHRMKPVSKDEAVAA